MEKKERYRKVLDWFSKNIFMAETELMFENPFQLLVAVILSAQCTDKRVNQITRELFRNYPDAKSMSLASAEEIFEIIKSCSYPNNKAKYLAETSRLIYEKYNGFVPNDYDELRKLPGVGRKTAHVIQAVLFNEPKMPVDTHVFRVANRIGLTTNAKTPLQVEKQLVKFIPKQDIPKAHHWLILHGRYICTARNPKCLNCGISQFCEFYQQNDK
ncbi:MAG: endonuclease III [Bacteroidales bacterium]|jgi:endonuclease-3|nr:endonuclease III [Bacteroidales bacterium]HOL98014.1 endonuclease III [Bacteroidales bacterium]HOM36557.1 endonuclease III [Bacteroidales bacterium]HPD23702.1 endonuclease III [Bacteroidales bacterium]HRS99817.1 endonuclease III [Bacteroidales bacterium]